MAMKRIARAGGAGGGGGIKSSTILNFGFTFIGIFLGIQIFVLVPFLINSQEQHQGQVRTTTTTTADYDSLVNPNFISDINHIRKKKRNNDKEEDHTTFDIVTLLHHDDISVFLNYGLMSWHDNFCHKESRIFIVCTTEAEEQLTGLIQRNKIPNNDTRAASITSNSSSFPSSLSHHPVWDRIIVVNQVIYPFTLELVGIHTWQDKFTWIYQQMLKMYSYEVLSTYHNNESHQQPPIRRKFLIMDSDTVAIRPHQFLSPEDGKPIYNVATKSTGAFENDCTLSRFLIREVFKDGSIQPAFANNNLYRYGGEDFTAITHYMMFDGLILTDMLHTISKLHGKPAWQVLGTLKRSVLSEWELYMAWIMKYDRTNLYLKQIPFMNAGQVSHQFIKWIHDHRDIVYLTRHDDYQSNQLCCVNSQWPTISRNKTNAGDDDGGRFCGCCTQPNCQPPKITCDLLGLQGCSQNETTGLMSFVDDKVTSSILRKGNDSPKSPSNATKGMVEAMLSDIKKKKTSDLQESFQTTTTHKKMFNKATKR